MHPNNSPSHQRSIPAHVNVNSALIGSPHLASKDKTKIMPLSESKTWWEEYWLWLSSAYSGTQKVYFVCETLLWGDEAALVLREFYLDLRQNNRRCNGWNPITLRQLESLYLIFKIFNSALNLENCIKFDSKVCGIKIFNNFPVIIQN